MKRDIPNLKSERIVGYNGEPATYTYDVGTLRALWCEGAAWDGADFGIETEAGIKARVSARPAFFFLSGLVIPSRTDKIPAGFVDDPCIIASLVRFLIHGEEYEDQLDTGYEAAHVDLPFFTDRDEAIAYLRKAGVRVHGDSWDGFDIDALPYPTPEHLAALREQGL